jgi:cytochrome c biogenesis protein ResB
MREVLNRAGSVKLTIVLLLILAVFTALGTILPNPQQPELLEKAVGTVWAQVLRTAGLNNLYHSIWLRTLMVLLSVNMIACLANRWPSVRSSLKGEAALRRSPAAVTGPVAEPELDQRLKSLGYRPGRHPEHRIYSRGSSSFFLNYLAHGSIVLIMLSAYLGSATGFVGTQPGYVGQEMNTMFNWTEGKDVRLPFTLLPRDLVSVPNPVAVRVGVKEVDGDRKLGLVTTYLGGTFTAPGLDGRFTITSLDIEDPDSAGFEATWTMGGREIQVLSGQELGDTGITMIPVQYRSWEERKAVYVPTVVMVNGERVLEKNVEVNHPLKYEGINIYLTNYGTDEAGFPIVGFQFVYDPGQPGVWAGSIILLVAMTGALFTRHSCVVAMRQGEKWELYLSSRGDRRHQAAELNRVMEIEEQGGDPPPEEVS